MKKFLFLLLLLPFFAFGSFEFGDLTVNRIQIWDWISFGSERPSRQGRWRFEVNSYDEMVSIYRSSTIGFSVSSGSSSPRQCIVPSSTSLVVPNSFYSITNSVSASTNGVTIAVSPMYFPRVAAIYDACAALYLHGYRGPAFTIFDNGNYHDINADVPLLVSDVLSSTNTAFSAILFSALGSISSGVASIDSGVSQLVPVVESVRDVNVNILSNSVSIVSNTLDIIDALIGDYPEEEPTRAMKGGAKGPYNDVRTSIKSQLQAWRNQATTQLQTWKTDLAEQLEAWKTSDETGYLNIRRGISNVVNQLETTAPNSTNKVPYTAYVTNYVTRVITNEIERSSKEISTNVAQAARQTRDFLQDNLIDPLFDANSPGINVNIRAPLWGQSQSAVHVHDSALDTFGISVGASLDDMNQWLGDIYSQGGDANDNWQAWFDRWDGFSEFTVGWFTDWWDLLADNMDSFYSAFYTADGTRRMMLELISNPEFRADVYQGLNWFQRVEYLLGFIANVSTGTVEVADIEDDMDDQVSAFENVGTNLVSASSRVVDLFDYVTRFSTSLKNAFQSSSAPVTDGIVLLQGDTWFTSDQPLVLRVDINVQNACRLGAQCIWYCGAFVAIWLVVSWAWGKILAVCRWLWSLFDI